MSKNSAYGDTSPHSSTSTHHGLSRAHAHVIGHEIQNLAHPHGLCGRDHRGMFLD